MWLCAWGLKEWVEKRCGFYFDFCNADAQTVISFLKTYGLDKDFKV